MAADKSSVQQTLNLGTVITAFSAAVVYVTNCVVSDKESALYSLIMTFNPIISWLGGYFVFAFLVKMGFRTIAELQEDRDFAHNLKVMTACAAQIKDEAKKREAQSEIDEFCLARTRAKLAKMK